MRSIIVIDEYLANPQAWRDRALKTPMTADERYFRGKRSESFKIGEAEENLFVKVLDLDDGPRAYPLDGYSCFQICVAGEQLVYHADEQQWAAVLFLTPNAPPGSGTSFWKSKATQRRHSDECKDPAVAAVTFDGKLLDRTAWEEVDRIGNVFNRLVIWDARFIHSASEYFGHSLETGRLFQMFFMSEKTP